jgi:serine/threonine protein kinase
MSIHDAHHFDDRGRATMAHTDIKPDQFLYQDGYYRLTDFNRVRFLSWNEEDNTECGFRVQKNGGLWRAPEEYSYRIETEKVDVYSLGNVLFFLLTGENPWKPLPLKEIYEKVMNGDRPPIPQEMRDSNEIFDRYMIQAMQMAWTHERTQRPGAFEVAQKLKEGIEEYEKQKR